MICLADIHLREETERLILEQVLPESAKAAVEEGSKELSLLGDVLHIRYKIDVRLQNNLIDVVKYIAHDLGVYVRFLPGNHDQYDVVGRNALEPLNEIDGVEVYTHPVWDKDGLWIPYRKHPADILEAVALPDPWKRKKPVAFMHHGIRGAMMNDHWTDEDGVAPDVFQKFAAVLLGHYHKRQTIGVCHYIGSPYQTKADESGQAKGYAIWDGQRLQYVDTYWGKRYHRFVLEQGDQLDLRDIRPGDDVRVRTKSGVDPDEVGSILNKAGIENNVVTPDVEAVQARLNVPENADLNRFALAYVEAQDTHLDKERLMQVFAELSR